MLPKTGNSFRGSQSRKKLNAQYAVAIAKALRKQLGVTHQATKTIMRWTGASERSAKTGYPARWVLVALISLFS
jgi:hypothetical protein